MGFDTSKYVGAVIGIVISAIVIFGVFLPIINNLTIPEGTPNGTILSNIMGILPVLLILVLLVAVASMLIVKSKRD